jgi:spore coat protein CotF
MEHHKVNNGKLKRCFITALFDSQLLCSQQYAALNVKIKKSTYRQVCVSTIKIQENLHKLTD